MLQYKLVSVHIVCHVVPAAQSTISTHFLVPCQDMSQGIHQLFVCCTLRLYFEIHRWYSQGSSQAAFVGPDCACEKFLSELSCVCHWVEQTSLQEWVEFLQVVKVFERILYAADEKEAKEAMEQVLEEYNQQPGNV